LNSFDKEHGGQTDVEGGRIGIWAAETHSRVDQYQHSTLIHSPAAATSTPVFVLPLCSPLLAQQTLTTTLSAFLDHHK
jgi:hypothetical protein